MQLSIRDWTRWTFYVAVAVLLGRCEFAMRRCEDAAASIGNEHLLEISAIEREHEIEVEGYVLQIELRNQWIGRLERELDEIEAAQRKGTGDP